MKTGVRDIRDHHCVPHFLIGKLARAHFLQIAKIATEPNLIVIRNILPSKYDEQMVEPGRLNFFKGLFV